jgi:hypothetical protein
MDPPTPTHLEIDLNLGATSLLLPAVTLVLVPPTTKRIVSYLRQSPHQGTHFGVITQTFNVHLEFGEIEPKGSSQAGSAKRQRDEACTHETGSPGKRTKRAMGPSVGSSSTIKGRLPSCLKPDPEEPKLVVSPIPIYDQLTSSPDGIVVL